VPYKLILCIVIIIINGRENKVTTVMIITCRPRPILTSLWCLMTYKRLGLVSKFERLGLGRWMSWSRALTSHAYPWLRVTRTKNMRLQMRAEDRKKWCSDDMLWQAVPDASCEQWRPSPLKPMTQSLLPSPLLTPTSLPPVSSPLLRSRLLKSSQRVWGNTVSSPSGSRQSPAAKRCLVHFGLKYASSESNFKGTFTKNVCL